MTHCLCWRKKRHEEKQKGEVRQADQVSFAPMKVFCWYCDLHMRHCMRTTIDRAQWIPQIGMKPILSCRIHVYRHIAKFSELKDQFRLKYEYLIKNTQNGFYINLRYIETIIHHFSRNWSFRSENLATCLKRCAL